MIGNDVVDLQLAKTQSNWQRKGFLEKQFTEFEISKILASKNPTEKVWLFWSMKEAAYKCFVQIHQKRFFAPKKFECALLSNSTGFVTIHNAIFYTTSSITSNCIYTVSSTKKVNNYTSSLFKIDEKATIFRQLKKNFSKEIEIKKNDLGVPFLYQQNKKLSYSLSISHHGNYGAYAYL